MNVIYTTSKSLFDKITTDQSVTLRPLFRSILSEHLLIDCYFKGSNNLHSLPQPLHSFSRHLLSADTRFFPLHVNCDAAIETIDNDDIRTCFEKIITYNEKLTDDKKN